MKANSHNTRQSWYCYPILQKRKLSLKEMASFTAWLWVTKLGFKHKCVVLYTGEPSMLVCVGITWGESLKYGLLGLNSEDWALVGLGWFLMLSVLNKLPR